LKQTTSVVILFTMIPLIASIGIASSMAFGYVSGSPNHQLSQGIAAEKISCKPGMVLVISPTGKPACAHEEHADILEKYGWGIIYKELTPKSSQASPMTDPMIATVQSSEVVIGDTMHKHMAKIETVDVMRESPDSNAYHVTYKVTAGDQRTDNIKILVVSDDDKVTGTIGVLNAHSETTLLIRIQAIDAGSIHGMISNYNLD